jgi:hypothetical protein
MTAPAVDAIGTATRVTATWTSSLELTQFSVYERIGLTGAQVLVRTSHSHSYSRTGLPGVTYCYQVRGVATGGASVLGEERCTAVPFDDRSPAITYSGTISQATSTRAFLGTLSVLDASGERASISATTRKVAVLAQLNGSSGFANVFVDGVLVASVDLYSRRSRDAVIVYTSTVPYGPHEIAVAWSGSKNTASTGTAVWLDGIAVIA